ncbi:transcriptional regulator [Phocaeicola coprophilus]|uniref:transcriptional regulator n=1 Tax=Phocaeicola coprophilus TaxID=387090 RepID=UPI002670324D|nr:transcriptional regulator [Phocaeicola coprophilus]
MKAYCETIHMTVSAFEKSIGVANGYVNSISKSIGIDKVSLILEKYPNINIEWLLTGKGDMLKTKHTLESCMPDNESISNKEAAKQNFSTSFIDKLFAIINDKENTIREQAEEIGRLKEQIRQMNLEKGKHVSDASISGTANVG